MPYKSSEVARERSRRWTVENREKKRETYRKWYEDPNNAEKKRAYNKRRYAMRTPADVKTSNLKRYGITLTEFERLRDSQNNCCSICNGPPTTWGTLVVDHCHATKTVRGLLCNECNRGLGLFKDSPNLLRAAASYIEKYSK